MPFQLNCWTYLTDHSLKIPIINVRFIMVWFSEFIINQRMLKCKSICPKVSCRKGVLKNFSKCTKKHLCRSLFYFNKVAGLRHVNLLKKSLQHRSFFFSVNFAKFLRTPVATSENVSLRVNTFHTTGLFLYPLKTYGFLMFSGVIERDHWHEMG